MLKFMKKIGLIGQVLIATILAILAGVLIGPPVQVIQPIGDLFLNLLSFVIVPLVFSTLVVGVSSGGSIKKIGRMGGKAAIYFVVTAFIAVTIGYVFAVLFSPGEGINIGAQGEIPDTSEATVGITQMIVDIVPANPIAALAETDILQIIFFALFIGVGIMMVGEKAKPVYNFFEAFSEIMYKIVGVVIKVIPIGIFCLLAPIIAEHGGMIMLSLISLVAAIALGCIVHAGIIYSITAKLYGSMSPIEFFKGIGPATMMAFGTSSSSATLPLTIKCSEENLGVSSRVTSFILPLGATVNMDGQAIYFTICCLFAAQLFGIELGPGEIITIALVSTLGSIGTAGMAGAGIVMLAVVMETVGLPLESIAIIAGVDRILNLFATATNVTGDAAAAVYVNGSERKHLQKHNETATEETF